MDLPVDGVARCSRCGAVLRRHKRNSLERTLALGVTGVILFVIANAFPFLGLELQAQVIQTTLFSGVRALFSQGMWFLGNGCPVDHHCRACRATAGAALCIAAIEI